MREYIGKVCPYCKTPFRAGDDIVICSDCDMPHHKDCWIDNKGCTTFGCLGTVKAPDGSPTAVTRDTLCFEGDEAGSPRVSFCPFCGAPVEKGDVFCSKCGARIHNR